MVGACAVLSVSLLLVVVVLSVSAQTVLASPPSVLVVVETATQQQTHRRLLGVLSGAGMEVTTVRVGEDMTLVEYAEAAYDNVLLFLPQEEDTGSSIDAEVVSQFVDLGNNLFIVAGPDSQEFVQEVINEAGGADLEEGTLVSDHFNVHKPFDDGSHTTIVASNFIDAPIITGENPAPVLFRGTGISLEKDNDLVLSVLRASDTAYTYGEGRKKQLQTFLRGNRVTLVSALQARNGARVTVVASPEMLSDSYFDARLEDGQLAGNEAFSRNLLLWTFQQRGVLRAQHVHFAKTGEDRAPEDGFRIMDDVTFQVQISEWVGNKWIPFQADDVQVEFKMLNPYERLTMTPDQDGRYSVSFRAPDVYGSFQFIVDYNRLGYNHLVVKAPIPVRPFAHDEYDRFIFMAYPYYIGVGTLMVGFMVFAAAFLFVSNPDTILASLPSKVKKD